MEQPTQIHKIDAELFKAAFRSSPRALVYEIKAKDDLALAWLEFDRNCTTDEARARLLQAWPKFEEGWAQRHNAYLSAKAGITKNPEACAIELKSYIEAWRVKLQKICEGVGEAKSDQSAPKEDPAKIAKLAKHIAGVFVSAGLVLPESHTGGVNPKKKRTTKQK